MKQERRNRPVTTPNRTLTPRSIAVNNWNYAAVYPAIYSHANGTEIISSNYLRNFVLPIVRNPNNHVGII